MEKSCATATREVAVCVCVRAQMKMEMGMEVFKVVCTLCATPKNSTKKKNKEKKTNEIQHLGCYFFFFSLAHCKAFSRLVHLTKENQIVVPYASHIHIHIHVLMISQRRHLTRFGAEKVFVFFNDVHCVLCCARCSCS